MIVAALPLAAEAGAALGFERIGADEGLPSQTATAVLRDRDGFVWVGTRDGLAMWDGYAMRVFQHDPEDPGSLPDNGIRALHEDRDGRLWIATNTGGLALLDRGTWRFEVFRHAAGAPRSLSSDTVYALADAGAGGVWVGTLAGLDRWDPATRTFERVLPAPGGPAYGMVMAVHEDARGRLWVGSFGGGLMVRDPASGRFERRRHDPGRADSLCSDDVLVVQSDLAGRVWIGTHDGLDRLDEATGGFEHVDLAPTGGPRVLVTSVVPGQRGTVWVGTMGRGLLELPPAGPAIAHREEASPRALPHDSVVSVALEGRDLWVATYGGGVAHARLGPSLPPGPARPHGDASQDDLQSVAAAPDGTIWAASFGGGLLEYAPGKAPVRHLYEPGNKGSGALHVSLDARGALWVGAMDRLWRYDPRSGRADAARHHPGTPGALPAGYVTASLEDRAGRRWVGLGPGGLVRLAPDGRTVEARLATDTPAPARLGNDYVTALLQDRRGTLWVGTRDGLQAVDPGTGVATPIPVGKDRRWSLPDGSVNCLFEDSRGRIWIGTGGGLSVLEPLGPTAAPRFEHFTSRDGLVDDDVTAVLEDDDGSLWIATRAGLSRLDPAAKVFASFDTSDGLGSIEFNPGAAARSRTALLFGTRRGLLELPRGTPFPQRAPSRTVLTAIRTPDGEVRARRPVWRLDALEVPYGRWVSVEMAVLDYRPRHRHRFSYRLGEHDPWIELGGRREVTFADLAPGRYRLQVRGRDARGGWSEAEPSLALTVVPPFWMTWAFRVPLALAVGALAFWAHRTRLRRLERRNQELVALRDEREAAYERLRQLTLHLEAVREDERRWIARELHDEMGQELTAAKINLQLLGRGAGHALPAQGLAETVQLLDRLIARVRSLSLDLRPPLLDDRGLRPAVEGWLEAVGRRSGIATRLAVRGELGRLSPDLEIAGFRVVQEAVTNALRHAAASALDVTLERDGGRLRLEVRDDGAGFDVAAALARSAGGDHLGLVGMRQRVEMLGGGLEIASAAGEGTSVRAWLPLEVRT